VTFLFVVEYMTNCLCIVQTKEGKSFRTKIYLYIANVTTEILRFKPDHR